MPPGVAGLVAGREVGEAVASASSDLDKVVNLQFPPTLPQRKQHSMSRAMTLWRSVSHAPPEMPIRSRRLEPHGAGLCSRQ